MKTLFTSADVCEVIGISYRQLDYWIRRGFVRSAVPGRGSGSQRGFLFEDLLVIYVFALYKGRTRRHLDLALMRVKALYMALQEAPFPGERAWLVLRLATGGSENYSDRVDQGSWWDPPQQEEYPWAVVGWESRYGQAYFNVVALVEDEARQSSDLLTQWFPIGRIARDLRQRVKEVLGSNEGKDETNDPG